MIEAKYIIFISFEYVKYQVQFNLDKINEVHNSRGILNFVLICLFKLLKTFFFSNLNQFILALAITEHDNSTDNLIKKCLCGCCV